MIVQFGQHTVHVDDDLWSMLGTHAWSVVLSNGRWEVIAWIEGHQERMHRLVWKLTEGHIPQGMIIDHVNRDSLDNRRANLRLATAAQNLANQGIRRGPKTSRYRGVRRRGSRWSAQIQVDGRQRSLGTFHSEESAAKAYDDAARRFYGEFAGLNFEEESSGKA